MALAPSSSKRKADASVVSLPSTRVAAGKRIKAGVGSAVGAAEDDPRSEIARAVNSRLGSTFASNVSSETAKPVPLSVETVCGDCGDAFQSVTSQNLCHSMSSVMSTHQFKWIEFSGESI